MSESLVLDIRKKTAQERLRGDHIELLHQLEDATTRNDQYEKEIALLQSQLAESVKPDTVVVEKESGEVIERQLLTIEALRVSLAELAGEAKTTKTKELLAQNTRQKQLQALQDELDRRAAAEEALRLSLEQRELALQQLLSTTRAEPAAPALPPANTSHDDHVRAMAKCVQLEERVEELTATVQQKAEVIQANGEEHDAEVRRRQDTYLKQKSVILDLESEKSAVEAQLSEARDCIRELEAHLQILRTEQLQLHTRADLSTKSCTQTDSEEAQLEHCSASAASQFREYLALKKEVMTLKLQLAHKESGRSTGRQSSAALVLALGADSGGGAGAGAGSGLLAAGPAGARSKHKKC